MDTDAKDFVKALGVLLILCLMALPFWARRQSRDEARRDVLIIEPSDAPKLEVDGRKAFRYQRFRATTAHPRSRIPDEEG